MKRKFIMMPVLIPGLRQLGNDIDVYLRPLVEELLLTHLLSLPGYKSSEAKPREAILMHPSREAKANGRRSPDKATC
jgi:hypothetical protein